MTAYPADGELLTIDDGTGRDSNITFEFDENGTSTTAASAPVAVGKSYNQLPDDVSVSGSFTGTKEMNFFVEIDGVGTPNTFRWSRDGGATFIDERVEINASTQSIAHGLDITFTSTTGHGLGDCWTFVAQPTHVIVTILNPGSTNQVDRTFARNALAEAMEEQQELGNLSIRTSTEATADQLYLFHSMDRLIENNVSMSGNQSGIQSTGG